MSKNPKGPTCVCGSIDLYEEMLQQQTTKKDAKIFKNKVLKSLEINESVADSDHSNKNLRKNSINY